MPIGKESDSRFRLWKILYFNFESNNFCFDTKIKVLIQQLITFLMIVTFWLSNTSLQDFLPLCFIRQRIRKRYKKWSSAFEGQYCFCKSFFAYFTICWKVCEIFHFQNSKVKKTNIIFAVLLNFEFPIWIEQLLLHCTGFQISRTFQCCKLSIDKKSHHIM